MRIERVAIGLLIALRIGAAAAMLATLPEDVGGHIVAADAYRYSDIATHTGIPWLEHEVEVPPLEVVQLSLFAVDDPHTTAVRGVFVQFALDMVCAWAVFLGWGRRASLGYLAIGLPLAPFLYFRLDLLSMALAVLGLALVRRRAPRAGALVLAAGVLAKLWPATIAVTLAAARRTVALGWMLAASLSAFVLWGVATAGRGPLQVLAFRGAGAWQIESTVGGLLLAFADDDVLYLGGANRIGTTNAITTGASAIVLVALLVWIGFLGSRVRRDALTTLAATNALLVCAPILSWQYVAWLTPWLGILAARRLRSLVVLAGAGVVLLTAWLIPLGVELSFKDDQATGILLGRNALLLGLLAACLVALRQPARPWETDRHESEPVIG